MRCSSGSATSYDPDAGAANDRLLRPAHLARLDAELRHARRGARRRWTRRARGSASSSRWRATSATSRAAPPRRASTWASCPGRSTCCSAATSAATIRDGVLYFAPRLTDRLDGLSFPMQFRGTPIRVTLADGRADRGGPRRGLRPARSGSASATRSASCAPATGARSRWPAAPAQQGDGERAGRLRGRDLRRRRRARRLAARAGVARRAARADGERVERHPRPDHLVARARSRRRSTSR